MLHSSLVALESDNESLLTCETLFRIFSKWENKDSKDDEVMLTKKHRDIKRITLKTFNSEEVRQNIRSRILQQDKIVIISVALASHFKQEDVVYPPSC